MVIKKIKKYLKKNVLGGFSQKCYFFKGYSWFFQKPYFVKSWGFLHCSQCIRTLLLSYQIPFLDIFFTIFYPKGGPLWFRTSQKLTTTQKMTKKWKQKYFCEQNYKWIRNPDGTACLKGWIKMRITLLPHSSLPPCQTATSGHTVHYLHLLYREDL